jgi:uncharacterized protein YggE
MSTDSASLIVEGVGRASAMPDLARIVVHVTSQGKRANDARKACAQQAETILGQLARVGVPREDMRTALYEVEQIRDGRKRDVPVIGCRASTSIAVTLHKPEELGRVIEEALETGPDVAWTAAFDLSSESEVKAEALGEAVKDARRKAGKMAAAAGLQIKRVVAIGAARIEEVLRSRPEPWPTQSFGGRAMQPSIAPMMASVVVREPDMVGSAAGSPVHPGPREYQAVVTMEFELSQ